MMCPGHVCKSCKKTYTHTDGCIESPPVESSKPIPLEGIISATVMEQIAALAARDDAKRQTENKLAAPGGLCDQCVVECTRPKSVLEAITPPITGKEEITIAIEHESVVRLMCQHDDWEERVENHIKDIEAKIASFRIKLMTARSVRAKKKQEELSKHTPEEIEEFKLLAANRKKKAIQPDEKIRLSKIEKLIEGFVKMGIPREKAEKMVKG